MHRNAGFALLLTLAACGKAPEAPTDLEALDRELTDGNAAANVRDPALTAALADQIMVDPTLTQTSNANAIRPPTRPDSGAVPPVDIASRTDAVDPATLKKAPPPSADCPECRAAQGALTLAALAGGQRDARVAGCAGGVGYSNGWANRLPADLALYPGARLAEAAGSDANGCRLRVVSFAVNAPVDRVIDWYYTRVTAAGYSAGHKAEGPRHVLGGGRGGDAYVVYVSPRSGGGSDVDLVSNAGT